MLYTQAMSTEWKEWENLLLAFVYLFGAVHYQVKPDTTKQRIYIVCALV